MVTKAKKFTEINPDTGKTWSRDELWTEKVTLQADVRFLRSQVSRLESDTLTVNDYRKDLTRRAKVVIRELTALFTDLRWTIDQARSRSVEQGVRPSQCEQRAADHCSTSDLAPWTARAVVTKCIAGCR